MKHLPLLFLTLFVAVGIVLPQQYVFAEVNSYTVSDNDDVESLTQKLNDLLKRYEAVKKELQNTQSSSGSWHRPSPSTASSTKPSTPNPAVCSFPWNRTLSVGSRGNEVSDLQKSLKAQGYFTEEATGYYGEQTEAAVQKFQKYHNIVSSGSSYTTGYGSFGNQTRTALTKVCAGSSYNGGQSFDIDDVKSVTKKTVDPIPGAADDEYTLYTITLENNKVVKVKACGFCTSEMREKQFTKAGYEGDVDDLIALATAEEDEANEASLEATPVSGDLPLSVVFTVEGEEGKTYKLDFGDRTSKKIVADDDTITHIYRRVGEFTAKLFNRTTSRSWSLSSALLDSVKITVAEEEEEDEDEEENEDEEEEEDENEDEEEEEDVPNPASPSGNGSTHDSCTTTYQSKTVAHGTYVSGYSSYFWQGPTPYTVVSPAKQCQDGVWKQSGYCNVNGVVCTSLGGSGTQSSSYSQGSYSSSNTWYGTSGFVRGASTTNLIEDLKDIVADLVALKNQLEE